jgi:hypothetical protein
MWTQVGVASGTGRVEYEYYSSKITFNEQKDIEKLYATIHTFISWLQYEIWNVLCKIFILILSNESNDNNSYEYPLRRHKSQNEVKTMIRKDSKSDYLTESKIKQADEDAFRKPTNASMSLKYKSLVL